MRCDREKGLAARRVIVCGALNETKLRLLRTLLRSEDCHIAVSPGLYVANWSKSFGDMFMLGSPNLYRGNASLATRLRIDDLRAQLAPLDRYGVGGMSFALTGGVCALVRSFGARCAAPCLARPGGRDAGGLIAP